jgi:M6 family metalloprotease-like protein
MALPYAKNASIISLLIIASLLLPALCLSIPASPDKYLLIQSNSSSFEAKQWGDERSHGWETSDGYTVIYEEKERNWHYAGLDSDGSLRSTGKAVGRDRVPGEHAKRIRPANINPVSQSPAYISSVIPISSQAEISSFIAPSGTYNIPVFLINFQNTSNTFTASDFTTLLFGNNNWSMKDFYNEASYGAFTVSPGPNGISGWYTAINPHDYYGQNGSWGIDRFAGTLVREVIAAADLAGFDFAPYDMDGDCYADVVDVIHQGTGEEIGLNSNDIWSHSWDLNSAYYYGSSNGREYTTRSVCSKGGVIKVNKYVIQPEKYYSSISTIGVFAHEYGHALGLPDLYDTDYSSRGAGKWSLMAYGAWNYAVNPGDRPAQFDAWSKYKLGWVSVIPVNETILNQEILPVSESGAIFQMLEGNPSSGGEYFIIENRQRIGFDTQLPGTGLLIWHIDEQKTSNNNECYPGMAGISCSNKHYQVSLVQADNYYALERSLNSGDAGDPYPGSYNITVFNSESAPNSNLFSGSASNVSVSGITTSGTSVFANFITSATITLGDLSQPYDGTPKSVTATTTPPGLSVNITYNGSAIPPTEAGSYSVVSTISSTNYQETKTGTLVIARRALTVTVSGINKVYDRTTTAAVTFSDDRVTGDILTVSGTASFSNKNVGTGKTVRVTGISISGVNTGNYTLAATTASTTADITARVLTVTATGKNRGYKRTTTAAVTFSDDRIAGDTLIVRGTASFLDKNVGIDKTVSVTGISISGVKAGNYTLAATTASTTANITARVLTVTATGINKIYDGTTTANVKFRANRVAGDTLTVSGNASFIDPNIGAGKTVRVTDISISGVDAGNYTMTKTTARTVANIKKI